MKSMRWKGLVAILVLTAPATATAQVPFWDYVALQAAPLIAAGGSEGRVVFSLPSDPSANQLNTALVVLEWFVDGNPETNEKRFVYCVKNGPATIPTSDCADGAHLQGTWSPELGITTTLPEPAAMGMLAAGLAALAGIGLLRRRRVSR